MNTNYFQTISIAFHNSLKSLSLILCMLILAAPTSSLAELVELQWDAPTTNSDGSTLTDLSGYKLYYGSASGNYSASVDVGLNTSYILTGLANQNYYVVVTAYNAANLESSYSNELEVKTSDLESEDNDSDGDGILDANDNCPYVANPSQTETDGDGIGDACDPYPTIAATGARLDFDGDGISDIALYQKAQGVFTHQIMQSSSLTLLELDHGIKKGKAAHGDYDGDTLYDLAYVTKQKKKLVWSIKDTATGQVTSSSFGKTKDIIVAGCDFDKDARSDLAVISKGRILKAKLSSTGEIKNVKLKLGPGKKRFYCADSTGDGADEIFAYSKLKIKGKKKGKYLTGFNLNKKLVFSRKLSKVKKLFAADIDGDGDEEPSYYKCKGAECTFYFFTTENGPATTFSLPLFKEATSATLSSSSGTAAGLISRDKTGTIRSFNFEDQSIETLSGSLTGDKLVHGINIGAKFKK